MTFKETTTTRAQLRIDDNECMTTLNYTEAEALAIAVQMGQPTTVTGESELALYAVAALLGGHAVTAAEIAAMRALVRNAVEVAPFGPLTAAEIAAAAAALALLDA